MNIRIHIILLSIICFGCIEVSKPIAKGMVSVKNRATEIIKSEPACRTGRVELRPNEGLIYYNDQPFTGRVISTFPNGITSEAIEYLKLD